jgi:riboflavin kinase/FMN adenylyltransferase
MEILEGSAFLKSDLPSPVVTIGNFDGVHIGHQRIFQIVTGRAKELGGRSLCYTFQPHPQRVIAPDRCPPLLVTRRKKLELIAGQGIDIIVIEPFTSSFAQQTAAEFMSSILYSRLHPREVYVGHDFHFGKGREASFATLQESGENLGFRVSVIEEVMADSAEVSSSRIRRLIAEGKVEQASVLLGRAFSLEGPVIPGAARGRELGFATANLEVENEILPPDGVYAVFGRIAEPVRPSTKRSDGRPAAAPGPAQGRGVLAPGVANIGFAPTFGRRARTVEIHFLDWDRDQYGAHLEVLFLARLREERKFENREALVAQIRKDIEAARGVHSAQGWRVGQE